MPEAVRYVAGADHALVWPGGFALLDGAVPLPVACLLWQDLVALAASGAGAAGGADRALHEVRRRLWHPDPDAVAGAAVAVRDEDGWRVAVRGGFEASTPAGDLAGADTWQEQTVGPQEWVRLGRAATVADAEAAARPVTGGVVAAGRVSWQVAGVTDELTVRRSAWDDDHDGLTVARDDVDEPVRNDPDRTRHRPTELLWPSGPPHPQPAGHDAPTVLGAPPAASAWAASPGSAAYGPSSAYDPPYAPVDPVTPMVLARTCATGHPNPPHATGCRECGSPLVGEAHRAPRPSLGTLLLPDGSRLELTRTVVVGRNPSADRVADLAPYLCVVPDERVSSSHLAIRLQDWHVLAVDLGSSNHTYLQRRGRPARQLPDHQEEMVQAGDVLLLTQGVHIVVERLR